MKFSHWEVLELNSEIPHHSLCVCICGALRFVRLRHLRVGNSKSCGCQRKPRTTHGMTYTPTYKSWENMMSRCYQEGNNRYYRYGKRGIRVTKKWHDFKNFLKDMGTRPDKKSIDRLNIDKNYSPSNCRWATNKQQANNTSRTRKEK